MFYDHPNNLLQIQMVNPTIVDPCHQAESNWTTGSLLKAAHICITCASTNISNVHLHNLAKNSSWRTSDSSQDTEEEPEAVEPQSRMSNRSTSLQSKEKPKNQKKKWWSRMIYILPKSTSLWIQESTMNKLKNELRPFSTCQPYVKELPLNQGAANSQGPAASSDSDDENSEFFDEDSARSQDFGRTVVFPDLYILTNDEHSTVTLATQKYSAAVGFFTFVTTANGTPGKIHFDYYAKCEATVPQGSDRQFQQHARKEASTQEVRGYRKQFTEAKHIEWKSWINNEVFHLVDLRKSKPKNFVTGLWVL